jgi:hypothetical protein
VSAYFISRILAEMPVNIIIPTIYATIIYWAVGLNPDPYRFLIFLAVVVLETQCAVALGYAISAISPDAKVAQAMGPPLLIILILFGGFYINTESLPAGSEWGTALPSSSHPHLPSSSHPHLPSHFPYTHYLPRQRQIVQYISYIKWAFQALCINEFSGATFECDGGLKGCEPTGEVVLERLSFNDTTIGTCVWANVVIMMGAFALALLALLVMRERHMAIDPPLEGSDTAVVVVAPAPSADGHKHGHRQRSHLSQDHRYGHSRGAAGECKDATIDGTYVSFSYDDGE